MSYAHLQVSMGKGSEGKFSAFFISSTYPMLNSNKESSAASEHCFTTASLTEVSGSSLDAFEVVKSQDGEGSLRMSVVNVILQYISSCVCSPFSEAGDYHYNC